MTALPRDPAQLGGINGTNAGKGWVAQVERTLRAHDSRIARAGASRTGEGVVWFGPTAPLPPGMLLANGAVVAIADYPALFDVIGTTYNTGGEGAGNYRLPNLVTPVLPAGVWIVRT